MAVVKPAPVQTETQTADAPICMVSTRVLRIVPDQPPIGDAQQKLVEAVEFLVVRVEAEDGCIGWGFNWNYTQGTRAVKVMVDEVYAPVMIGRSALRRKELLGDLSMKTHFIGRVGVALVGLCAIELALWDIACKRQGLPLWKVLGASGEPVKAYNTDGGWLTLSTDDLVKGMGRLVDRGFDRVKMKIGLSDPREDIARVKAVRRAIGDDVGLMIDVNTCWDLKTALEWAPKFEPFKIDWLEEPLHPFDIAGHARLAEAIDIPIAVGETVYTQYAFREFLERKAAGILQADVTKLSGIDEWLEVARLAKEYNVPVIPHTNVQQKVHVQLAASCEQVPMIECCYESLEWIWEEPITVREGHYTLPQAPGVGLEFRKDVLEDYRIA